MNRSLLFYIFIFLMIAVCNCEIRKPNSLDEKIIKFLPVVSIHQIEIPESLAQTQDSILHVTMEFLNFHNSISDLCQMLVIPKDSIENGPPWNYQWTNPANLNLNLYVDETIANNMVYHDFQLFVNGYDPEKNLEYKDWNYLHCIESPKSDHIFFEVFQDNSRDWLFCYWYDSSETDGEWYKISFNVFDYKDIFFGEARTSYSNLVKIGENISTSDGVWVRFASTDFIMTELIWNWEGNGMWERRNIISDEIIESGAW